MAIKTSQYLDSVGLERFYGILNSSWWSTKWKESWNSSVGSMISKDDTNINNITNGRVVTGINANTDGTITYQTAPLNIKEAIGSLNLDVLVRMNELTVDSNKEYPILSAPSDVKTGDIKESYYKSNITINPHNNTISTWSGELKGGVYGYASAIGTYTDNKWTAASIGSLTRYIYLENGEFKLGDPIPQGTVTSVNIIQGNGITVTDSNTPILGAGERTISLAAHAVSSNTYGIGTTELYGHVKLLQGDSDTNFEEGLAVGTGHTHSNITNKITTEVTRLEGLISSANSNDISSFEWKNGTTEGPTATITKQNGSTLSVDPIPAASKTNSGVLVTSDQVIEGTKDFFGLKENGTALADKYQVKGDYLEDDDVITASEIDDIIRVVMGEDLPGATTI